MEPITVSALAERKQMFMGILDELTPETIEMLVRAWRHENAGNRMNREITVEIPEVPGYFPGEVIETSRAGSNPWCPLGYALYAGGYYTLDNMGYDLWTTYDRNWESNGYTGPYRLSQVRVIKLIDNGTIAKLLCGLTAWNSWSALMLLQDGQQIPWPAPWQDVFIEGNRDRFRLSDVRMTETLRERLKHIWSLAQSFINAWDTGNVTIDDVERYLATRRTA